MKRTLLCIFFTIALSPLLASASVSIGTIDPLYHLTKLCQDQACSVFGTVNWKPTINASTTGAAPVVITDIGLSGFLWGDEIGWVSMASSSGGVTIDPHSGALSGYAFANTGSWINFHPTQSAGDPAVGVSINANGEFIGYAYVSGIRGGWMKFDCASADTCIKTDWRPVSSRTSSSTPPSGGGGGGGGAGVPIVPIVDSQVPAYAAATRDPIISAVHIFYDAKSQMITVAWSTDIPTDSEVHYLRTGGSLQNAEQTVTGNSGSSTIHVIRFFAPPQVLYMIHIIAHTEDTSRNVASNTYNFLTPSMALVDVSKREHILPVSAPSPLPPVNKDRGDTMNDLPVRAVNTTASSGADQGSSSVSGGIEGGGVSHITPKSTPPFSSPWITLTGIMLLFFRPLAALMKFSSLSDAALAVRRIFGILTLRRRRVVEPWGTVYDSMTKRPLDPAYVSLISRTTGKEVVGAITDLDGRYGFLVGPGDYTMMVSKTHYAFPSKKLLGKANDPVYDALYFGEEITIGEQHDVIKRNIPLDAVSVDWNEEEKKRMGIGGVGRRRQLLVLIMNTCFTFGFVYSLYVCLLDPRILNITVVALYIAIVVIETAWKQHFHLANVKRVNGKGLAFAVIKLLFMQSEILVKKIVADEEGNFYLLAAPGAYQVVVEERFTEDVYRVVHRSPEVKLPKGILMEDIIVPDIGVG